MMTAASFSAAPRVAKCQSQPRALAKTAEEAADVGDELGRLVLVVGEPTAGGELPKECECLLVLLGESCELGGVAGGKGEHCGYAFRRFSCAGQSNRSRHWAARSRTYPSGTP